MDDPSVFEGESLDPVGEITRGGIGIAAVESGDEDAPAHFPEYIVPRLAASVGEYLRPGGVLDGGFHAHLVGNVRVDEIPRGNAAVDDREFPGGDALAVIEPGAGFSLVPGPVHDGQAGGKDRCARLVQQERVLLLDGEPAERAQHRCQELGGAFAVHDDVALPAGMLFRADLRRGALHGRLAAVSEGREDGLQPGRGVPPVTGVAVPFPVLHRDFIPDLEGCLGMAGEESVGVHDHGVEDAVGVLSLFGEDAESLFQFLFPVPDGRAQGQFPPAVGGN